MQTEAWILHAQNGNGRSGDHTPARLVRDTIQIPEPNAEEVLVEPLIGSWEGNMSHAVQRNPIDVCRFRNEPFVVLGNAGVVRVLRPGAKVRDLAEGDLCVVFCNGVWDEQGYPLRIYGYDAERTFGLLAKRTKLHRRQLIPLPRGTRHSLRRWAAFSLRYVTAWANWKLAYGCYRLQCPTGDPHVWGWGGGVALAELQLARDHGCRAAMMTSFCERARQLEEMGIRPIDRRPFQNLAYDPKRCKEEAEYRAKYQEAETNFLNVVNALTEGGGVSIFVDLIGLPVFRATLKALARPGVVTTSGWKLGMDLPLVRALECMNWHMHIHTHYARYEEGVEAVEYAEENGWVPPEEGKPRPWESIDLLGQEHADGLTAEWFPLFEVNAI
jgi:NADPH:quinone reductase-like Zn-dependent oxidoreductase